MEEDNFVLINRYASIITRFGHIYYDKCLSKLGIGGGQQVFLLIIKDHPGISQYELARKTRFDKGTIAKAVKKLEQMGLLTRMPDESDKRFNKLFITEASKPVILEAEKAAKSWVDIITEGMTNEEIILVEKYMKDISERAVSYIKTIALDNKLI